MRKQHLLGTTLAGGTLGGSGWVVLVVACGLGLGACFPLKVDEGAGGTSGGTAGSSATGTSGDSGSGATGSGGASTGGTSTAGGGLGGSNNTGGSGGTTPCMADTDCLFLAGPCVDATCVSGQCMQEPTVAGVPTASQIIGDCRTTQCNGMDGIQIVEDALDVYDDGLECTAEFCEMGVPKSEPTAPGTPCNNDAWLCNDNGACVECITTSQCGGTNICVLGACVLASCANGTTDAGETDVDCGGACTPCTAGKNCQLGVDCASAVCTSFKCVAAGCSDNVLNGDETGLDCGGSCATKCGEGAYCVSPGDCQSGACVAAVCKAPTCTDGIQNGGEAGADCGGGCPFACSP